MLNRISHLIIDHWFAKLIAIILAFGLWAFVVNTGFRTDMFADKIPVVPRDVPTGLAIATQLPEVEIEVFAPTASFQRLRVEDVQAFVNLAGLKEGEHTLEIKVFADDPNVRILEITPSLIEVTLEQKKSQDFEIKVETEGQLGQGFVADKAELDPNKVTVTGAASLLDKIDQVVVRLPLNGETSDLEKQLEPAALDSDRDNIEGLTFEPGRVNVMLPVIQAEDAKSVGIEVQTTGQPSEGFLVGSITTDPNNVTTQGSSKALAEISTLKTEVIDISGASSNVQTTVKFDLPDNIRAEPEQVSVTIEIKAGTLSEEFTALPEVINLGSGLGSTIKPTTVALTLAGPADKIKEVRTQDIRVDIDMSGRGEGTHVISLTRSMLNLPTEIQINFVTTSVTVVVISS